MNDNQKKKTRILVPTGIILVAFLFSVTSLSVYAQQTNDTANQSSVIPTGNTTFAIPTEQPETTIVNKTTIPVEQTNITVTQTTEPVSEQALQPLGEIGEIQQQPQVNLSSIENRTILDPAGQATTTIVNETEIPFNQTTISAQDNANVTATQEQQNQTSGAQSQQQQGADQARIISGNTTEATIDTTENATVVTGGGQGQQEQQGQQNQNQNQQGPLEQLGEAVGGLIPGQ